MIKKTNLCHDFALIQRTICGGRPLAGWGAKLSKAWCRGCKTYNSDFSEFFNKKKRGCKIAKKIAGPSGPKNGDATNRIKDGTTVY